MTSKAKTTLMILLSCWVSGCADKSQTGASKKAPARIEKHPSESDIYVIRLTPKAVERLGIRVAEAEYTSVPRQRTFGGIVTVPHGQTIVVSAPVPGTLRKPPTGRIPVPGTHVEAGLEIFSLIPLLSPERYVPSPAERVQMADASASLASAQIVAEGDVKQARAETDAAKIAFTRAERLLEDKAGSRRAVDEAKAALEIAQKKLEAAQSRKSVLDSLTLDSVERELKPLPIVAPQGGILRNVSVTQGQTVTAGTALFEVVNLDNVWIRAPVYVGRLDQLVPSADAKIGELNEGSAAEFKMAKPIGAPPSADPLSSTVDLYFTLPNHDGSLRPGERVGVTLPLKGESKNLVVPRAAILHDIHGTAWVYEQTKPGVYRRRRVLVKYTADNLAVLAFGPEPGAKVVTDGAAELFGTEFGAGK